MKHLIVIFLFTASMFAVDYYEDIEPIFNSRCVSCHGYSGGLSLLSYYNLMNGSNNGDVVVPGDHESSLLWQEVDSGDMPPGNNNLTSDQINLIAQWIDEGAYETVPEQAGDINGDSQLNVLDVVLGVNIILNLVEYTDEQLMLLDFNNDGSSNVLDIVQMVNTILDN